MGLLLPIITKSVMGNYESIITHYEPTQLADVLIAHPPILHCSFALYVIQTMLIGS